jgi:cytochrome c biogenesis protein
MSSEIETRPQVELVAGETKESAIKPEIKKKEKSYLDEFLKILSSVKLGVTMLVILMLFSAIGTFVVQIGTSDFPKFVQQLTPAEKSIYEMIGFFDIYHTWYFNLLLLTMSLNIILASIDRAPGYWHFFRKPTMVISESSARHQQFNSQVKLPASAYNPELISRIGKECRRLWLPRWVAMLGPLSGLVAYFSSFRLRVSEGKDGSTTIFAERGVWNRFAFCCVHVALLMILLGWFVGNKWGHKGLLQFAPGEVTDTFFQPGADDMSMKSYRFPFKLQCIDIKQDLIDASKPDLSPQNTLDWHTTVIFSENGQKFKGNIHLNEPIDFKGYRFFQSSFDPMNTARQVTLLLTPTDGQGEAKEVTLLRNSFVDVPEVGRIIWKDFYPSFSIDPKTNRPFSNSAEYMRPAAEVRVEQANGTSKAAFGFPQEMLTNLKDSQGQMPVAKGLLESVSIGNYAVTLKDYEKVSRTHTLQVQYDPGVGTVYAGCTLLVFFLITVFFFSHERVWVLVKPGQNDLQLFFAGNTNRNRPSFEARYQNLLSAFDKNIKKAETKKEN